MSAATTKKRELLVRRISDRTVVDRIDVSTKSNATVERVMRGMLINMSPEFFIDDSGVK